MSVVWRAHDEVLGRAVAVKVLSRALVTDSGSRQRIRAEARAAAGLTHPNIAGVYDYGESGGARSAPYIVMELLTGGTLADLLEEEPLPIARVLRIGAEVAGALAAAHEQGIVHQDVKPANVMVSAAGAAKVVDFGVAAAIGELTDGDAVVFGTPAYVAPERLSGAPVVPATDAYGLGVLLYRMLSGYLPWPVETTTEMLSAHLTAEPDPLPPIDGLPTGVAEMCAACLAKEPTDRPALAEVAALLAAAGAPVTSASGPSGTGLSGAGPSGAGPSGVRPQGTRGPRRSGRRLVTAGAVVVVIAGAIVATALARPGGSQPPGAAVASEPGGGGGAVGEPTTASQPAPTAATSSPAAGVPAAAGPLPAAAADTVPPAGGRPVGGGQGGDPDPPAPGPGGQNPPPSPPEPRRRSASEFGNSVTVECVGAVATIVSASPAEGWSVTRLKPGPAEQVNVRFTSATIEPGRVSFKSRCRNGEPRINPDTD